MKKTDIAMLILIAARSIAAAYFAVGAVPILQPPKEQTKVPTIERYSAEVIEPEKEVFNSEAINPTVPIIISVNPQ